MADQLSSEIQINPSDLTVSPGESFTVDVYVNPGEPIMGVAFYLSYDPAKIHADSLTEGNLFKESSWSTLFNSGGIDNVDGSISSVYGLIIGAHNVTNPGVFCTINFTAQNTDGVSSLHLYNVQMTNATGDYVTNLVIHDGDIKIDGNALPFTEPDDEEPETPSHEPSNQAPDTPYEPSGPSIGFNDTLYTYSTSTIDQDNDNVYYKWDWGDTKVSIWLGPFNVSDICTYSHSWNKIGIYHIKVKAKDVYGHESSWSSPFTVEIQNQTKQPEPNIENIPPNAFFNFTPNQPTIEDTVEFIDESQDIDGNITRWLWDFGDNTPYNIQHPTHHYAITRTYIVTLTVCDDNESTNITHQQLQISNKPCIQKNEDTKIGDYLYIVVIILAIIIFIILLMIKRK
jgi:hypothetical protein